VRNIFDYDDEFASKVFSRVPKISKALKAQNDNVKGLNIVMNNEPVAYQTVFHSHIHLIPRYHEGDGFEINWADNSGKYSDEQLYTIKNNIVNALEE
ncbi:HIT domain-containing protein, partial [Salmonella enterica]|uniref:HIT domain-containing protein n=1 Tax=Salmonella enterica TaxID=28901 RepID=UPI000C221054